MLRWVIHQCARRRRARSWSRHLVGSQAEGVRRQLQVARERVQGVVGRLALDLGPELAQRRFCVVLPPAAAYTWRC